MAIAEAVAKGFASGGEQGLRANRLREQARLYKAGKLSAYFVAETCARSGDKPGAMEYLEAPYKERAGGLGDIEADLAFKKHASRPRLPAIDRQNRPATLS